MDVYSKIVGLCGAKNEGNIFANTEVPTPRVNHITDILDEFNIDWVIDKFKTSLVDDTPVYGYNVILPGSGDRMVMAHHDIVNAESDNANDNSASIICAIALKLKCPEVTVALVDGEEFGGIGSSYLSIKINKGAYGNIDWVLNLELSGRGGKNFFIGSTHINTPLKRRILELFPDTPQIPVPFNDSKILRAYDIDSININPTPLKEDGSLDLTPLRLCHSLEDTVDKISEDDMKIYVEEVLVPILS